MRGVEILVVEDADGVINVYADRQKVLSVKDFKLFKGMVQIFSKFIDNKEFEDLIFKIGKGEMMADDRYELSKSKLSLN